ncbi:PLP-dependent transferase [Linderina pennispora]|uniref:PLP-dependent transferase n=1 Tax=Linderina pennispora TaxID=61395 RepID=A0A1Y1WFH3_9FUNG|nr:PLP-dependent transferase [Linderina pennispora]ORX72068.1 PLP-dependent transferase [Linderina pennispora]
MATDCTAPVDDYGGRLDAIRHTDYPQLFSDGTLRTVYLDHAGSTLCSASHVRNHTNMLLTNIPANPHSRHESSQWTHARNRAGARPPSAKSYAVVFTANATAAIKLAGELAPMDDKGIFCYTQESHTSVVGVRKLASNRGIGIVPASILAPENTKGTSLLAYPAQCNFSGQRFPLTRDGSDAHAPCSPLALDDLPSGPDFIFGMPTGLGALLIKRSSIPFLRPKQYFGGGTIGFEEFRADAEARYEDGTLNYIDILSVNHAIDAYTANFGSPAAVSRHAQSATQGLTHSNGIPIGQQGPIVAFNMKDPKNDYIGYSEVERLAVLFCNPGAAQKWLNLSSSDLIRYASLGVVCGDDNDVIEGKAVGALRISFGAMTSQEDIDMFVGFLTVNAAASAGISVDSDAETRLQAAACVEVDQLIVYPVKSCHGYTVPVNTPWDVTPHGLRFDSTIPMQQKRYPRMALIRPQIDTQNGALVLHAKGFSPLELDLEHIESRVSRPAVSGWLSSVLSVPCYLACEPTLLISGMADGSTVLHSLERRDSACFARTRRGDLSFANESQILLVTRESAQQVEDWVLEESDLENAKSRFGPTQYRPNIVGQTARIAPFEELKWSQVSIAKKKFQVSGPCRRCQMIGVNQESAQVLKEPYATLARKMRINGKVVFGIYLDSLAGDTTAAAITAGSLIRID